MSNTPKKVKKESVQDDFLFFVFKILKDKFWFNFELWNVQTTKSISNITKQINILYKHILIQKKNICKIIKILKIYDACFSSNFNNSSYKWWLSYVWIGQRSFLSFLNSNLHLW